MKSYRENSPVYKMYQQCQGVARVWETRGRRFKSSRSDHFFRVISTAWLFGPVYKKCRFTNSLQNLFLGCSVFGVRCGVWDANRGFLVAIIFKLRDGVRCQIAATGQI